MTKMITKGTAALLCSTIALAAAGAMAEDITLEVTAYKGNSTEPAGFPEILAAWEKRHPNIKIDLQYISRIDSDVILPSRMQGGNPPDVMMTDMPMVKAYSDAGELMDFGTDSDFYKEIVPGLKKGITGTDGGVYIVPLEIVGFGNYVNMDLLAQVGIEKAPTQLEEVYEACGKLADAGINPMQFSGTMQAAMFIIADGMERAEEPASAFGSGEVSFEGNDAFQETMQNIRNLVDAKCFDPRLQAGLDPWTTGLQQFKAGNFAMMPQGAWNLADISATEGLNFQFAPLPGRPETGVGINLLGMGWSVSSKTEHPEEARMFAEFFIEEQNLQETLDDEGGYSPYINGLTGVSDVTAPFEAARQANTMVYYPFTLNHWPKALETGQWDSLTSYLLDINQDIDQVLARWDEMVREANQ